MVKKYEMTNLVHKRVLDLSEEISELSRELIMDGKPSEQEVNQHLQEIIFTVNDNIEYQISLIRNLMK